MFQLDILWKSSIEEENTKTEYLSEVKFTSKSKANMKGHFVIKIFICGIDSQNFSFIFFFIILTTSHDDQNIKQIKSYHG